MGRTFFIPTPLSWGFVFYGVIFCKLTKGIHIYSLMSKNKSDLILEYNETKNKSLKSEV